MNSFLKWPGGKKWFVNKFKELFPTNYNNYYEPFLGGGSVFFEIAPHNAILSDINDDLISLFEVMRDSNEDLISRLNQHQNKHSKEYYYSLRKIEPIDKIERAARMLYLNRTCFNGMYRVNKSGKFNVPIGSKVDCLYDINKFDEYSKALKNTVLLRSDFSEVIARTKLNDLIFADPPYTVSHNQNSFIKYNEILFSWEDQLRLLNNLSDAKDRGVNVISTNAYFDKIIDMYEERGFCITKLERHSNLASNISKRRQTEELLITSFPHNKQ